jgi:hypothetical protein
MVSSKLLACKDSRCYFGSTLAARLSLGIESEMAPIEVLDCDDDSGCTVCSPHLLTCPIVNWGSPVDGSRGVGASANCAHKPLSYAVVDKNLPTEGILDSSHALGACLQHIMQAT